MAADPSILPTRHGYPTFSDTEIARRHTAVRDPLRLRLVRSAEEIAFLHVAAELTDRSIDRPARALRPRLRESESCTSARPSRRPRRRRVERLHR